MNENKALLDELIDFAQKNDNVIRYDRIIDIAKDKNPSISDCAIEELVSLLQKNDILIPNTEDEDYSSVDVELETFIPSDVNISQKPMNIYNLIERLKEEEIDLYPDFQRKDNLWSPIKQSQLIESLMLKIPIPTFYFNAIDDSKWIVIDGLQRLSALKNFLIGTQTQDGLLVKQKFIGMQYMKEFNGKTYDDLPRQYIRRINETPIVAYTVEKGTPEEIVYNIFQRINTGGVKLEPQEIRNALYQGKATKLTAKLATCKEFLEATQNAIRSDRMADREYVNRFIAFTELDYKTEYKGNIDMFLRQALKKVNTYPDEAIQHIEQKFKNLMHVCHIIFGKYAFRKFDLQRRGPINKALFECCSIVFNELTEMQLTVLLERKNHVLNSFREKFKDPDFYLTLKAGDQYTVAKRIDNIRNLIRNEL